MNSIPRHRRLVIGLAAGITTVSGFALVAPLAVEAAPPAAETVRPRASVPGDHHSPAVVRLAGQALVALSSDGADSESYRQLLGRTAATTAAEVGASARQMQLAWLGADEVHQHALLTALSMLGKPYQSISSDPDVGFDCSGLTTYAWAAAGVELPRNSGGQISAASERTESTAMAGDLTYYPGHVMMYLGAGGAMVHASNHENDVELYLAADRSLSWGNPIG